MAEPIMPVTPSIGIEGTGRVAAPRPQNVSNNPFDAVLSKAVDSLEGISRTEIYANQLINSYLEGKTDISQVLMATSKMSIMVQLATTTINTAVTTFKELTQMQV